MEAKVGFVESDKSKMRQMAFGLLQIIPVGGITF